MIEMLGARIPAEKSRVYEATLPLPPSINRTYAFNSVTKRLYTNVPVKQWEQEAYDLLMVAGWKPLSRASWTLALEMHMHIPESRDIDSGEKLAQDVLCSRLEVDDCYVRELLLKKFVANAKKDQHLQVWVTATCLN